MNGAGQGARPDVEVEIVGHRGLALGRNGQVFLVAVIFQIRHKWKGSIPTTYDLRSCVVSSLEQSKSANLTVVKARHEAKPEEIEAKSATVQGC